MLGVKVWDAIVVGGGVIGLAVARELHKDGARVLIVERGEPGREASHAAAGMLADADLALPEDLKGLAAASARMYPEFAHELEDESGMQVDLRRQGTIAFFPAPVSDARWKPLPTEEVLKSEPRLEGALPNAYFAAEATVDPRALVAALLKAVKHRGIEIASGAAVTEIMVEKDRAIGVRTTRTHFSAPLVINCAGAWAGEIGAAEGGPATAGEVAGATTSFSQNSAEGGRARYSRLRVKPIKGQMLAVIAPGLLQHVVRAPEVYVVPRSGGRVVIGSTLEDKGFDKRVEPEVIQRLHQAAAKLIPQLGEAKMHEAWAGLRPGTADVLPILGHTALAGSMVAAGHYRDGILLTPITARVMAQLVRGAQTDLPLQAFSAARFG